MSKMTISKRTFLHAILLLACDFSQSASALARTDNLVISSAPKDGTPTDAESVVEYFKDHEVSEKQARNSLRGIDDFSTPARCKKCSREHLKYCHSENLLKDHCCCNQSHNKSKFNDMSS